MSSKDPFLPASRWRMLPVPLLAVALLALVVSMGVASPAQKRLRSDDLRSQVLSDFYRLKHAVEAFVSDIGALPPAAMELTAMADGGLSEKTSLPPGEAALWKGPYLVPPLVRPTASSFWSLEKPCHLLDKDGDGAADEVWACLHRGHGEIDDASAAWLDGVLDDGMADRGLVRVAPESILLHLLER